jgi:hypothetical protein
MPEPFEPDMDRRPDKAMVLECFARWRDTTPSTVGTARRDERPTSCPARSPPHQRISGCGRIARRAGLQPSLRSEVCGGELDHNTCRVGDVRGHVIGEKIQIGLRAGCH